MPPDTAVDAPLTANQKKNKKKKAKAKAKANGDGDGAHSLDTKQATEHDGDEDHDEPDSPVDDQDHVTIPNAPTVSQQDDEATLLSPETGAPMNNTHQQPVPAVATTQAQTESSTLTADTEERLAEAARERDQLKEQVTELRKSLETLRQKHEEEVSKLAKQQSEEREAQMRAAEAEEKVADTARERDALGKRIDELKAASQQQHKEHKARLAQQDEERAAQKQAMEEHEQKAVAASRESETIREQLAELTASLEGSRAQHEEELAHIRRDHEEEKTRLSQQGTDRDAESHAVQGELAELKATLEGSRAQHEEQLAHIRQEHEEERTRLSQQGTDRDAESQAVKEQLAELQTSIEDSRVQHEEQIAHIRREHEEEKTRLSQQGTDREAERQASNELEEKLASAMREKDDLSAQLATLKQSLEGTGQQQEEALAEMKAQLEESQTAREHAESQYKTLLGKVNTIRSQLGERLKADAADLAQARTQIADLEDQITQAQNGTEALQQQIVDLSTERDQKAQEVDRLRNRANMTQQNWISERDDLVQREALAREEFDTAKQAMQDWEVLAMEERSIREGLGDRVAELEEQLTSQQNAYERAASERDEQTSTVDGLQRALQDIHEARKQELREMVENYQTQLEDLRKQLKTAEDSSNTYHTELETLKQDLERAAPFEKEVKEKNLLIGKLRHEAVILNDHLTKALKYIKRSKPDDTVDKTLITNHILQFLTLDRTDPKKFQVLQLLAAILAWSDEQLEAAGLARPGASHSSSSHAQTPTSSHSSLRMPFSPFVRRVSSSASFHQAPPTGSGTGFGASTTSLPGLAESPGGMVSPGGGKESLSELWSGFLAREADGGVGAGMGSRRVSVSSASSAPIARPGPGSPTVSRYALPRMEEGKP